MVNPLVLIAPADHPLASETSISLARFTSENFVVRERGSGTRSAIERHFKEHGIQFQQASK